jgi:hypothetical protein
MDTLIIFAHVIQNLVKLVIERIFLLFYSEEKFQILNWTLSFRIRRDI